MRPGRLGALLVLAGLAAAVAMVSTGDPGLAPVAVPTSASRVLATMAAPTTSTFPTSTTTTPSGVTVAVPDPLDVVEGALVAWGAFAVTGDMAVLESWFDPKGPQYRQLAAEAEELAAVPLGPPSYSVAMFDPVVVEGEGETRVTGRVVFSRPGEASQSFAWDVVVRGPDDRLRIWTVSEVDDEP